MTDEMTHEMTRTTKLTNLAAVVVPFCATLAAIVLFWNQVVSATDLAILALMYLITAGGITVGFHRMLTHRSFRTHKVTEYAFAVLGTMAERHLGIGLEKGMATHEDIDYLEKTTLPPPTERHFNRELVTCMTPEVRDELFAPKNVWGFETDYERGDAAKALKSAEVKVVRPGTN